jgi:hypothetical protein
MRYRKIYIVMLILVTGLLVSQCRREINHPGKPGEPSVVSDGQQIFRFDNFGDEDFGEVCYTWIRLLPVKNGGFGPGVSPKTALAVGLKVTLMLSDGFCNQLVQLT